MNIADRVKNILLTPKTEWPVIAAESTPQSAIVTGYILPLAALAAVAALIGASIIGYGAPGLGGTYRVPLANGLMMLVWSIAMAVAGCFVMGAIIDALAPTFGAQKNSAQAFKVAAYAFTPVWVAGVFRIIPMLGILSLLGAIYAIYLLYLGLNIVMKAPEDKAIAYTAAVAVVGFVVMMIVAAIGGIMLGAGAMMTGAFQ